MFCTEYINHKVVKPLGNKKTRDRILPHFLWPGIFSDVASYCRSCPKCQKITAKGRISRVPLISPPLIEEPFKRIVIDYVGPLPQYSAINYSDRDRIAQ